MPELARLCTDDFFVSPQTAPLWWEAQGVTRGAWGCLQAHRAALDAARGRSLTGVLILEGDAVPTRCLPIGVSEIFERVVSLTPDLDVLYLGGQYLDVGKVPPRIDNVLWLGSMPLIVLRDGWPIRLHAYCLTWFGIRRAIAVIDEAVAKQRPCHVDHLLGAAVRCGRLVGRGLAPWLYGQAPHLSAVRGVHAPGGEWQLTESEWRFVTRSIPGPIDSANRR